MKKIFLLSMLLLFISNNFFAQSSKFTDDEMARIKFSVHLFTYDTANAFDNARGEAYYTMLISAFKNNLTIPSFIPSDLSFNDKTKTEKLIQYLKGIKQNPPTWQELYQKQTQYLIWKDKVTRRHTKYKG